MSDLNPNTVLLTNTQKGILAIIHNSPTPESAYESINGSPSLVTSRNILERLGLISVSGIQAALTDAGQRAALANNIMDDAGNITEEGERLIDDINSRRGTVYEGFALLSSLV